MSLHLPFFAACSLALAVSAQTNSLSTLELATFGSAMPPVAPSSFGRGLLLDANSAMVLHGAGALVRPREFVFNGAAWVLTSEPNVLAPASTFAYDGDLLLSGQSGQVGVHRRAGQSWSTDLLDAPGASGPRGDFGRASAIDGAVVVIAEPGHSWASAFEGALHVYEDTGQTLEWRQTLRGDAAEIRLGQRVALQGNRMLAEFAAPAGFGLRAFTFDRAWFETQADLGAYGASSAKVLLDRGIAAHSLGDGAVRVFALSKGTWHVDATLESAPGVSTQLADLALADGVIAVSAPFDDGLGDEAGAVVLYARRDGWKLQTVVRASDAAVGDRFGSSIVASGRRMLVGAVGADSFGVDAGAVYELRFEHDPARVYCVSERTSDACSVRVGFDGVPSASSGEPFWVRARDVPPARRGSLIYGTNGAQFGVAVGPVRCIAPPRRSFGSQESSSSSNGSCGGAFNVDFNARIASGIDPLLQPGHTVWAQWVLREPVGRRGMVSSEGVEFVITP